MAAFQKDWLMSVSIFLFDSFAKVDEAWFASLYKVQETS